MAKSEPILNIRDACMDDLPTMLDIYNDAVRNLTATFDLAEQTIEERELWFKKYGLNYPLIVAVYDGEVAGYCGLSAYNSKAAYAKTVELSIYLSSKHRGHGIGSLLLSEIIERATQLQYHSIIAGITEGNEGSVRLHEKYGFEFAGRLKEVGFKFEQWQNVLYLQLILKDEIQT